MPALVGESGYTTLERRGARPTLDVNGIWGGFQGAGSKTIIPASAHAKVTCRLVADQDPERVFGLLRDEVLRVAPPGVRVEVISLGGGRPTLTPIDHPATRAFARALEATFGRPPLYIREGGSIPVAASFASIVGLPVIRHGVPTARRQLPRPERVDGPRQLRGGDPGARPILRRAGRGGVLTGWYSGRVSPAGAGATIPTRAHAPSSATPGERVERVSTEIEQPAVRGPKAQWRLDADTGSLAPRSALDVLVDLNDKIVSGNLAEYQPIPLGFTPLDKTIGGGLRPGELLLIGGAQGTGKTTMALQMARNVASGGQANVLYICFEHEEQYLLNRLIALESALAHLPHKTGAIKIQDVRREILGSWVADGQAAGSQLA